MSKDKVPIRRQHVGVGFFGLAHQEKKEKLTKEKKEREVKKNARARLKSNS